MTKQKEPWTWVVSLAALSLTLWIPSHWRTPVSASTFFMDFFLINLSFSPLLSSWNSLTFTSSFAILSKEPFCVPALTLVPFSGVVLCRSLLNVTFASHAEFQACTAHPAWTSLGSGGIEHFHLSSSIYVSFKKNLVGLLIAWLAYPLYSGLQRVCHIVLI